LSSPCRHVGRAEVLQYLFLTLALGGGDYIVKITLDQTIKAQRGSTLLLHSFFNLGTRYVVSAMPQLLYPWERSSTHCIGGWVGPRAGLFGCGKSCSHQDLMIE